MNDKNTVSSLVIQYVWSSTELSIPGTNVYIYIYTRMQFFSIHMGLQGKLAIPGTNAMERF